MRNSIIIAIVLLVLLVSYNMAVPIWEWLSCSNNSTALQAVGSIVQAVAASLTLGAMICLGIFQNKISKQQLDLAMAPIIKNRICIYDKIISAIIFHKNNYPVFLINDDIAEDKKKEECIRYYIVMAEKLEEIKAERSKINNWFEKSFTEQAENLIDEEIKNLENYQEAKINFNIEYNNEKSKNESRYANNPYDSLRNKCGNEVDNTLHKIENIFKPELQFRYSNFAVVKRSINP